jgi:hypothetical protein
MAGWSKIASDRTRTCRQANLPPAFALQHHMHTAIAIPDPRRDDLVHSLPDRSAWVSPARATLCRPMLSCHPTGLALAVAVRCHA